MTFLMQSIIGAWELVTQIFAGIGLVYILRWYWWRINAWSEISALAAALFGAVMLKIIGAKWFAAAYLTDSALTSMPGWLGSTLVYLNKLVFPMNLLILVPFSIVVWFTVTMLTKPVDEGKLIDFYKRVYPGGPGWKRIREKIGSEVVFPAASTKKNFVNYLVGIIAIYSALLGIGELILGSWKLGVIMLLFTTVCGYFIYRRLSEEKWES